MYACMSYDIDNIDVHWIRTFKEMYKVYYTDKLPIITAAAASSSSLAVSFLSLFCHSQPSAMKRQFDRNITKIASNVD